MFGLSISARQALSKLTLPVLFVAAIGLITLGKAEPGLVARARMAVADRLAPLYGVLALPVNALRGGVDDAWHLWSLRSDNERLREENARLRSWQAVALALEAENATLKSNLHWIPDPAPSYVTARVVADIGSTYSRAVLLATGLDSGIQRGEIALDARGLVGRVTETGARSARVLLITDINSRVPVLLEGSRLRAMLVGTNGPCPRLMYWPEGGKPIEGARVVTGAEASAFPAGLPVGTVHYVGKVPEVVPFAALKRLDVVRIFDYGLHGVLPPENTAGNAGP